MPKRVRKWKIEFEIENNLNWPEKNLIQFLEQIITEDLSHYIGFDKVKNLRIGRIK
jgi:predicted SprT family Zn-dependent metalloprotease